MNLYSDHEHDQLGMQAGMQADTFSFLSKRAYQPLNENYANEIWMKASKSDVI